MLMRGLKFIILPSIIVCCATNSTKRIPEVSQRQAIRSLSGEDLEKKSADLTRNQDRDRYSAFLARYILANQLRTQDPKRSCEEFLQLVGDPDFWAKELAQIRAFEVCEGDQLIFLPGEVEMLAQKPWYRLEYYKAAHTKALKSKNSELEMRSGFELALYSPRKRDRVQLIQRSVELADLLNKKLDKVTYFSELARVAPRFRPNPTPAEYMDVAEDFKQARDFKKARSYYARVATDLKRPFAERIKAQQGIAKTYKIQLSKADHIKALEKITKLLTAEWKKKRKDRAATRMMVDSYIELSRAQWTNQQTSQAQKNLDQLEGLIGQREGIEQVYWLKSRIEEENGETAKALGWTEKSLELKGLSPAFYENALWQKAWQLRKLNRLAESKDALKALKNTSLNPFGKAKYSYWLGRTLSQLSETGPGTEEYAELLKFDPYGFYGMLAARELKQGLQLPDFKDASGGNGLSPEPASDFDSHLFTWLNDTNETEIARRFLENYLDRNPGLSKQKLIYMGQVGLYNRIYGELSNMDYENRNTFIRENFDFFFPQSYAEEYLKAEQITGVNRSLLLAITRQESGFDPFARSHADAFGLMQLLPEVAESVSKKIDVAYQQPEDLYIPNVNVPIGAYFINTLLRKFENSFIPSVGSYNASEGAIRNWIKTRFRGDPTEFIEEIPYEETKSYVKLVMRNFIFYEMITNPNSKVQFPEWCLQVLPNGNSHEGTAAINGVKEAEL